jgi:hypothetical protein
MPGRSGPQLPKHPARQHTVATEQSPRHSLGLSHDAAKDDLAHLPARRLLRHSERRRTVRRAPPCAATEHAARTDQGPPGYRAATASPGSARGRAVKAARNLTLWLDIPAHGVVAALEPVVAHEVLMNTSRQQPRLVCEPVIDQGLELIELRRHPLGRARTSPPYARNPAG